MMFRSVIQRQQQPPGLESLLPEFSNAPWVPELSCDSILPFKRGNVLKTASKIPDISRKHFELAPYLTCINSENVLANRILLNIDTEYIVLALRGLVIAILALGLWTHADAAWANNGVSAKSHGLVLGVDETSATEYICCHRKNDHKACRLRGLHFNSESLVSRASEFDPFPNVVLHNIWDVASYSLYVPFPVSAAGSNLPAHDGSIYLTTLRLRL